MSSKFFFFFKSQWGSKAYVHVKQRWRVYDRALAKKQVPQFAQASTDQEPSVERTPLGLGHMAPPWLLPISLLRSNPFPGGLEPFQMDSLSSIH